MIKGKKEEGVQMGVCPLCNGLSQMEVNCPSCGQYLEDNGKMMDYLDDYSPYMPIEQMKLENGYLSDYEKEECLHYLICPQCGYHKIQPFQEW